MNAQPDFIWTVLKMFTALGILLLVLIIALYLFKRVFKGLGGDSGGKMIRVLSSAYVGVKKNISLVEVPGAILVVGITSDTINLLDKIEDEEVLQKFKESETANLSESFSSQLQKLSARYKREKRA